MVSFILTQPITCVPCGSWPEYICCAEKYTKWKTDINWYQLTWTDINWCLLKIYWLSLTLTDMILCNNCYQNVFHEVAPNVEKSCWVDDPHHPLVIQAGDQTEQFNLITLVGGAGGRNHWGVMNLVVVVSFYHWNHHYTPNCL